MRTVRLLLVVGSLALPVAAQAVPVTYSGYLDDATSLAPASGVLVDFLMGPPDLTTFPDQNVALFEFVVAAPTAYTVTSRGYNDIYGNTPNVDGFEAYIAIFQGSGPAAVFLEEFVDLTFPFGDFQAATAVLASGTYTLAISMWNNFACANGLCFPATGTLADGFSGLSNPDLSRALYFEVDLDDGAVPPVPVPEPGTIALVAAGAAVLARRHRRRTMR